MVFTKSRIGTRNLKRNDNTTSRRRRMSTSHMCGAKENEWVSVCVHATMGEKHRIFHSTKCHIRCPTFTSVSSSCFTLLLSFFFCFVASMLLLLMPLFVFNFCVCFYLHVLCFFFCNNIFKMEINRTLNVHFFLSHFCVTPWTRNVRQQKKI